jgi:nucleoside-diphosphate-sugar epimerase
VARKNVGVKTVAGPVGVMSRNFSNEKIYSIGWRAQFDLKDGIAKTYPWIAKQVRKAAKAGELS